MSTPVGDTKDVPWGGIFQGTEIHGALVYGSIDVLTICQDETIQGEDIVHRRPVELTSDDQRELERLDLPPDQWEDDASILVARYNLDPDYNVTEVIKSRPGEPVTAKYVRKQIEILMNNTQKDGVTVNYIGPGKRSTGDWCFEDGYITFREIAELYMNHFRGRVLFVHNDCSYAGQWLKELQAFLDEQGVQPCGHSARDKGILIKMFASCQSNEVPYRLLYWIRVANNDKNKGTGFMKMDGLDGVHAQHAQCIDSTDIICNNKPIDAPCTLKPGYTWQKHSIRDRICLLCDRGHQRWQYILLVDDQDMIDKFKETVISDNINVADYGQVLRSGLGEYPPNDVKEWIENYETS